MKTWKQFLENHYDKQGFWAGRGGGASGILPIAINTGRLCLAWRSSNVHMGRCWGTIGGAIQEGMSPGESAKAEMAEETGYAGHIILKRAFVFSQNSFRYFNFIGIVPNEFTFQPHGGHSWETDKIQWFSYEEINSATPMHPGLTALLNQSKPLIEQLLKQIKKRTPNQ